MHAVLSLAQALALALGQGEAAEPPPPPAAQEPADLGAETPPARPTEAERTQVARAALGERFPKMKKLLEVVQAAREKDAAAKAPG